MVWVERNIWQSLVWQVGLASLTTGAGIAEENQLFGFFPPWFLTRGDTCIGKGSGELYKQLNEMKLNEMKFVFSANIAIATYHPEAVL